MKFPCYNQLLVSKDYKSQACRTIKEKDTVFIVIAWRYQITGLSSVIVVFGNLFAWHELCYDLCFYCVMYLYLYLPFLVLPD